MSKTRRDSLGRTLRKGESIRKYDKMYVYTYTDPFGKRRSLYAKDLLVLREKEEQLRRDQLDGLDVYVKGKATVMTDISEMDLEKRRLQILSFLMF